MFWWKQKPLKYQLLKCQVYLCFQGVKQPPFWYFIKYPYEGKRMAPHEQNNLRMLKPKGRTGCFLKDLSISEWSLRWVKQRQEFKC